MARRTGAVGTQDRGGGKAIAIAPRRVLVAYWTSSPPGELRPAIRHHLEAIKRGPSSHRVTFWNASKGTPTLVRHGAYDAVILHNTLLWVRWFTDFDAWRERLGWLRDVDCLKIAMPQDEYDHSAVLDEWLGSLRVDDVLSVFGPKEWPVLYPTFAGGARFHSVLTGYIDDDTGRRLEGHLLAHERRPFDVVYRANHLPYWFGSFGQLKHLIGEGARREAAVRGLKADISTRGEDAITGDDWFDFLASGRAVVGCESGSSVLDPTGGIKRSIQALLRDQPGASLEDVSAHMPAGWDSYRFATISPRHFEAVITKTCQVLVEGSYAGVLVPGRHYESVREDFSNLGEVLERASDPSHAEQMTEAAYDDVYRSGRYSYRALAEELDRVLETRPPVPSGIRTVASAVAIWKGSRELAQPTADPNPDMAAQVDVQRDPPASPARQLRTLLLRPAGRKLIARALRGRLGRSVLRAYVSAGSAASAIPASRLLAECGVLEHMSRAQMLEPRSASFRSVKASSLGPVLELSTAARSATATAVQPAKVEWPPQSIVVRGVFVDGLMDGAAGERRLSGLRLDAVSKLASIRPDDMERSLRPLLDGIGGARARPGLGGSRSRLKTALAAGRAVVTRPGDLGLFVSAIGRASLWETADDVAKLGLLRGLEGDAHLAVHLDPSSGTLCLTTEDGAAATKGRVLATDAEVKRLVWDNTARSDRVLVPILGRRMTVFLGAVGVHEFTALEALPRRARDSVLRRLRI